MGVEKSAVCGVILSIKGRHSLIAKGCSPRRFCPYSAWNSSHIWLPVCEAETPSIRKQNPPGKGGSAYLAGAGEPVSGRTEHSLLARWIYLRLLPGPLTLRPGTAPDLSQLTEILRGIASCVFFKLRVRTPSSSLALICCWSILFDSVNDRAKWPTLYSV